MSVPAPEITAGIANAVDEGVRQADGSEIPQAEIDAVKRLFTQYSVARAFDTWARQAYTRNRRYAAGTANPNWASDANIVGSFIDILVSFLYAKDPDVSVRPAKHVKPPPEAQQALAMLGGDKTQFDAQAFSETSEIIVSHQWRKAKLKKNMKKLLRSALTVGPGWMKALMYSPEQNPLLEKELSDLQDNLRRIQSLQADLIDESDEDREQKIADLQSQITAVQAHVELSVKKGLCIDFVRRAATRADRRSRRRGVRRRRT